MKYLSNLLKTVRGPLAQEDMARMIGVRLQTYRNWEAMRFRPSAKSLPKIEEALDLKIDIRKLAEE